MQNIPGFLPSLCTEEFQCWDLKSQFEESGDLEATPYAAPKKQSTDALMAPMKPSRSAAGGLAPVFLNHPTGTTAIKCADLLPKDGKMKRGLIQMKDGRTLHPKEVADELEASGGIPTHLFPMKSIGIYARILTSRNLDAWNISPDKTIGVVCHEDSFLVVDPDHWLLKTIQLQLNKGFGRPSGYSKEEEQIQEYRKNKSQENLKKSE